MRNLKQNWDFDFHPRSRGGIKRLKHAKMVIQLQQKCSSNHAKCCSCSCRGDFPILKMVIFHSYATVYQRVNSRGPFSWRFSEAHSEKRKQRLKHLAAVPSAKIGTWFLSQCGEDFSKSPSFGQETIRNSPCVFGCTCLLLLLSPKNLRIEVAFCGPISCVTCWFVDPLPKTSYNSPWIPHQRRSHGKPNDKLSPKVYGWVRFHPSAMVTFMAAVRLPGEPPAIGAPGPVSLLAAPRWLWPNAPWGLPRRPDAMAQKQLQLGWLSWLELWLNYGKTAVELWQYNWNRVI